MKRNPTPAMISIRLEPREKRNFQRAVLRKDRTVSQVLRDYIRKYVGRAK